MAEFIEDCSELNGYQRHRNKARIRFRIGTSKCNLQLNNRNVEWKQIDLFMNNLEWRLNVGIDSGKISIRLRCNNQIINTQPTKVKSSLRILNNNGNQIVLEENLPELTFNKNRERKCLVQNYEIDAVTMVVHLTCQPILPNDNNAAANSQPQLQQLQQQHASTSHAAVQAKNHDAEMLRQELARMRTANDALKKELEYYKQDEDAVQMFIEVLRLFKSKSLKKFQHQMQLGDNVKVHLKIDPVETHGDHDSDQPLDANLEAKVEEYKEIVQQQENEIARLQQQAIPQLQQQNKVHLETINADHEKTLQEMQLCIEKLNTINDKLQIKVTHLEDELKQLNVFKEAIRLFEMKCCNRFEYDMELSDNIKIHFSMMLKENDDSKSTEEKLQYHEQRLKELEAEMAMLKQQQLQEVQNN